MPLPTIFETCQPRADILKGEVADADFAADLASVIGGKASPAYADAARFFANTYPTRGLRNLLSNVCRRLSGGGGEAAAIFRLDTSYGGGKTHGLIALVHAARGMPGVDDPAEFVDPALLPSVPVRIAAFDGENADPANGHRLDSGQLAYTPWGEIGWALAGKTGYDRVRRSDEERVAPGASTLAELFGGQPTLILLDELSVYLRKVRKLDDARDQLTAFLTSLFKAVEGAPNAALVYTLAIGKGGGSTDAYSAENRFLADQMAEAESVSARKATLLNPTADDETNQILRRRLFERIDEKAGSRAVDAYRTLYATHSERLPSSANHPEALDAFRSSYPLHSDVLATLTGKTATLVTFQRVRGMLRLLAQTVSHLWKLRPADASAIHLHHIDPGHEPIRQEIVTRLNQDAYAPALANDVCGAGQKRSLAQEIDNGHHRGMPPYAEYVARTAFLHTLAFNEPLKGLTAEELRYSMLSPELDISFIDEARRKFQENSAYLDDRPTAPLRFLVEANLSQIIRREEQNVDREQARAEVRDRIREIFHGPVFDEIVFPGGPFDVPDEVSDGRPKLVVLSWDAVKIHPAVDAPPQIITSIFSRKGAESQALRALRNHLVFVAADEDRTDNMLNRSRRRLALRELRKPDRLNELAPHQQDEVKEQEQRSQQELAIAIQQAYRHVFYPSQNRMDNGQVDLAHTAVDLHSASHRPGAGQQQVVRALRELNKLRLHEDDPDSPVYVRDRTPLKKGQISTGELRDEFRRDPALPILSGNDVFRRGIRYGIEQGDYVYQSGDLLCGPGDPTTSIAIDEQAVIFTIDFAKRRGIWPRPKPEEPEQPGSEPPPLPPPEPLDPPAAPPLSVEAPLAEALARLWDLARDRGVETLAEVTVEVFDASDAFPMVHGVAGVPRAGKSVCLEGEYRAASDAIFRFEFSGATSEALPVREFLEAQFRAASTTRLSARFRLSFQDGLAMTEKAPEELAERLVRFTSGSALVSGTPHRVDGGDA